MSGADFQGSRDRVNDQGNGCSRVGVFRAADLMNPGRRRSDWLGIGPLRLLVPPVTVILTAVDMGAGTVLIVGPPLRLSAPSFTVAKQVMPMWAWGALILTIGFVAVVTVALGDHPGLMLSMGAGWFGFFCISLALSAAKDNTAGLLGCVFTAGFLLLHIGAAVRKV